MYRSRCVLIRSLVQLLITSCEVNIPYKVLVIFVLWFFISLFSTIGRDGWYNTTVINTTILIPLILIPLILIPLILIPNITDTTNTDTDTTNTDTKYHWYWYTDTDTLILIPLTLIPLILILIPLILIPVILIPNITSLLVSSITRMTSDRPDLPQVPVKERQANLLTDSSGWYSLTI